MLNGTLTSGVKITASINSSNSPGGTTYGDGVNGAVQGGVRKLYIGYSKEEIDTKLNAKQNTLTSAQLETINADHSKYLTEHQDISGKQDVINDLANIRSGASLGATALQSYTETDPIYIADKPSLALKSELFSKNYNDLTNKPTIPSISGLASESYVTNAIKDKADKSEIITSYNDLSDKPTLFDGNYNSLTNKPTIPTVPTKVSAFTNDSGYITNSYHDSTKQDVISNLSTIESNASAGKSASDTISGYGNIVTHNASEFLTEHQDISGKQDKLTAGDNITITNNVISASGGGGTYTLPTASATTLGGIKIGDGLTITNGVVSASGGATVTIKTWTAGDIT